MAQARLNVGTLQYSSDMFCDDSSFTVSPMYCHGMLVTTSLRSPAPNA